MEETSFFHSIYEQLHLIGRPGGFVGEVFASLSFAGALVAMLSFFMADRSEGGSRKSWKLISRISYFLHVAGVLGIVATLFTLIYTHQYQYHYVWSHSSNELPVHFMISCFWEGQEGSFLLWSFWHAVLGIVLIFTAGKWKNMVMAVLTSVNLILASMILGVSLNAFTVKVLFSLALGLPGLYLMARYLMKGGQNQMKGVFHLALALLAILSTVSIWLEKDLILNEGLGFLFTLQGLFTLGALLFLIVCAFLTVFLPISDRRYKRTNGWEWTAGATILALSLIALFMPQGPWKIGSSPFLLLKEVMTNAPIFASKPDFVPKNGSGLNPLLQNYWMVIHPPTLFLGFASCTVPFAFVVAGLLRKQFTEWIRPAAPWLVFSAMILGVGIIMGGYWAYETLNFGGYWNWDPVENGSLVPWLIAISALHGMVVYRKGKGFLTYTMVLVILTFLLILYSTFLTRSGILGDTSVHTFTDLGLSGQLLVLVFVYFIAVISLLIVRWNDIPRMKTNIAFRSADFFLFLGTLVFIFGGTIIMLATSIPVFNKIFGSHLGGIKDGSFFYYRYLVYFAIAFGVVSGMGQFLFWRRLRRKSVRVSLLRPFILALFTAAILIILLGYYGREFGFEWRYREWLELADLSSSPLKKILLYLKYGFFIFSDEFLLAASLFTVFANLDMLISILRYKKSTVRVSGGSIAHIGFGLMLLGILLSSGFESVVSGNITPGELPRFSAQEQADNVLLLKNRPRMVPGYNPRFEVTYLGKVQAKAPVSDIRILEEDTDAFKLSFRDSTGEVFALVYPKAMFIPEGSNEIDMGRVESFTNEQLGVMKPKLINERTLYGVRFTPLVYNSNNNSFDKDESRSFTLLPEAEVNEGMGLIAHPARRIKMNEDIYIHVSSIPKDEEEEPKFKYYRWNQQLGDTIQTSRALVILDSLSSEPVLDSEYDLIAKLKLRVIATNGEQNILYPLYRITHDNKVSLQDAKDENIHTTFAFTSINPTTNSFEIQAEEVENPVEEWIVLKAISKPWINLLWLGTFVLVAGFGIAIYRRVKEVRKETPPAEDAA